MSMPEWDALHPLIIHFPIALFMIAPLFVIAALIMHKRGQGFSAAAVTLLVIGTVATWIAVSTGEAAGELAERGGMIDSVLERHESLAELTRGVFTAITALYAVALGLPLVVRKLARPSLALAANGVVLVLLLGANLLLVNTAHQGGRLVHEFGVHALMPISNDTGAGTAPIVIGEDDDD